MMGGWVVLMAIENETLVGTRSEIDTNLNNSATLTETTYTVRIFFRVGCIYRITIRKIESLVIRTSTLRPCADRHEPTSSHTFEQKPLYPYQVTVFNCALKGEILDLDGFVPC